METPEQEQKVQERAEYVYRVIKDLVSDIRPVGSTHIDETRYENLCVMCEVFDKIDTDLDAVAYDFKDHQEYSIKRSVERVNELFKSLNMQED